MRRATKHVEVLSYERVQLTFGGLGGTMGCGGLEKREGPWRPGRVDTDTVLNRPTVQVGRALHVTQLTVRLGTSSNRLVTCYSELFACSKTGSMAHAHLWNHPWCR